jgi:hypothetical protein
VRRSVRSPADRTVAPANRRRKLFFPDNGVEAKGRSCEVPAVMASRSRHHAPRFVAPSWSAGGPSALGRVASVGCLSLALVAPLASAGCASVQNVRTFQAHTKEDARLDVVAARAEDLDAALQLVDRLLLETPITPGDPFVERLALTSEQAARIGKELHERPPYATLPEHEVPIVSRYRAHLEPLLDAAPAPGPDGFPSLLAAADSLAEPGHPTAFVTHWTALRDASKAAAEATGDDEKTKTKEALRTSQRDLAADLARLRQNHTRAPANLASALLAAVSVAYRVELEALTLLPIVATQTARALPEGTRTLGAGASGKFSTVAALSKLPDHLANVQTQIETRTKLLDLLTHALLERGGDGLTMDETPGFRLKESALSQVIGVTGNNFHAHARAGAEAFLFSALRQNDQTQSEDGKTRKDLTGRLRTLRYDVKPILLTSASVAFGFDYGKITNALGLNLGYKTDRVFSSGGSVETGSLSKELGVGGAASDALDLGLGVFGVRSNVRLATFNTGTVTYADAAGNELVDTQGKPVRAAMQIHFTQIDLGYDLGFLLGDSAKTYAIEELTVGARYFKYELPRILYELENVAPAGSDSQDLRYRNESRPQSVPSTYYMGGLTSRFGRYARGAVVPPDTIFSPFFELGFYVGGGPTSYRLRKNKAVACSSGQAPSPSSGTECVDDLSGENAPGTKATAIAFDVALALGARVRLAQPGSRFRLSGEAVYRAELLYANTTASSDDNGVSRQIDFGNADLFHGPRLNLVGDF